MLGWIAIVWLSAAGPLQASLPYVCDEAREGIDRMMSPEKAIETETAFLSKYFPDIPLRESVVTSPISVIDLLGKGDNDTLFYLYAGSLIKIKQDLESEGKLTDRRRFTVLAPRLHLLNLINKLIVRYSYLHTHDRDGADIIALSEILEQCFTKMIKGDRRFFASLADGVELLLEIEHHVAENRWNADDALKLIPRIANNLVEYMTLTTEILEIGHRGESIAILEQLCRLVVTEGSFTKKRSADLRRIIRVIDEGVSVLRDQATNRTRGNPAHAHLIADIVTLLATVH